MIFAVSIVPQIYKSWVTRSSGDISTATILMDYLALGLATVYGVLIDHEAIYVCNSINLGLYVIMHLVKYRNEHLENSYQIAPV